VRRLKWPGEAAVVVSVVHVVKGEAEAPDLDGRKVRRISAYLVEGDLDVSPEPLAANSGKAFQGSIVLGMGFTFDDAAAAKGEAESLASIQALIRKDPRNAERIFPYIGGEEVNTSPNHAHSRYVIDFASFPLKREPDANSWLSMTAKERDDAIRSGVVPRDYPDPVAADWPDLLDIVERRVRPSRAKLGNKPVDLPRKKFWWRHASRAPKMYEAIKSSQSVVATLRVKEEHAVTILPSRSVFANTLYVITTEVMPSVAMLQSRVHELWVRKFSSTLEERATYSSTDCYLPFPFPVDYEVNSTLDAAGRVYHEHRAALMVARVEGLAKTYSRFHDLRERAEDISRLRELHTAMDQAVFEAYARGEDDEDKAAVWRDLARRAQPEFIKQEADEGKNAKTRLDWPQAFKDEVLGRLLDLNAERAAAEKAAGLIATSEDDADEDED